MPRYLKRGGVRGHERERQKASDQLANVGVEGENGELDEREMLRVLEVGITR